MSAEEWSAAIMAGLESMEDQGSQLNNQADFLPTSSQSPGNSPQPSPDSQQKDLGAAVPSQSQSLQSFKAGVNQPLQLPQQHRQMVGLQQQDQQISQSSDLAGSQSPVFRGGSRPASSSGQEGNIHKSNQSLAPVGTGASITYSSQTVHKVQPPFQQQQHQQRLAHSGVHGIGHQPQLNHPRIIQPQQRPMSKTNSPSKQHQQGMQMSAQSNITPGIRAAPQSGPTGQPFPRGSQQQAYHPHPRHPLPPQPRQQQQQQRMPAAQRQLSPVGNAGTGIPQHMGRGQRMASPRFSHQKQPLTRPHLMHGSGGNQNRPNLSHHVEKQQPGFSHHNPHSNPLVSPGSRDRAQVLQSLGTRGMESGVDGDGHGMGFMPDDEMYDEDYEGPMQDGLYDPDYEGEEEEDEDEYDEEMEEGQYPYDPSYGYEDSASDDLSEEESTLFEELSHLDRRDPRYEEIVNRLREKGVDRDEIDEIINPQRQVYHQAYEHEGEEDEEMDEEEGTVSSSSYSHAERGRQLPTSQAGTRMQQVVASQPRGFQQGLQNQGLSTFPGSSQNLRVNTGQQQGQLQQISHSGQTQQHELNSLQSAHSQQQQNLSQQPSPQGHAQKPLSSHSQSQHPMSRPNLPSSSHIPQLQQNYHQKQQPKTIAGKLNQPRKVFQSPVQSCSSTTPSKTSDWQQHGPRLPMPAKSLPSSTVGPQPPRQMGPNRQLVTGQQMGGVVRPVGQIQSGTTLARPPVANTIQGSQSPRSVTPVLQSQQGTAIQPPMVRSVSPRAMPLHYRMALPGGSSPHAAHRPGFFQQSNVRPRTPGPRMNNPMGPRRAAAPAPPSQASQSRLDVEHMQEMLDKQIMAKKGASTVTNPNPAALPSQSTDDQSQPSVPSQNSNVFQPPLPRPSLPPRRPVSAAQPPVRFSGLPPRRPVAPQGLQPPVAPRFNGPVRPRTTVPLSPPSQQAPSVSQARMGSPSQTGPGPSGPALRPPSFNLDALTDAKLNLLSTRSGKLVPNKTYQIKSPIDQTIIYAVWNGEKFVDANQDSLKGLGQVPTSAVTGAPSQQPDSQPQKVQDTSSAGSKPRPNAGPGGSTAFQEQFLQSLQTSGTKQQESVSEPDTNTFSGSVESPLTQLDKPEPVQAPQSTSQSTYVKPCTKAPSEGPSEQKNSEEEDEDEDDDSIFKKPFSENEDVFRVCNNCGYTSKNFKRCDGCKKVFHGEMKIHCIKKTSAMGDTPASEPSSSGASSKKQEMKPSDRFREVMSKASFYGNKDGPRGGQGRGMVTSRRGLGRTKGGGWKGKAGLQPEEEEPDYHSSDEEAEDKRGTKRRQSRPKAKTSAPKKRSKKSEEPVTVTISSDEDEPSSTSNLYPGFSPSPAHSAGSESPIFATTHMNPVNAFGRFRRVRMEDEEGQSKLQKKLQMGQNKTPMVSPEEELEEDEEEDGDEPAVYEIDIRSVRIGSMRTQPQQPMFISLHGVCFKCRSERTEEEFECEILCSEVEHVKFFAGQPQPVLFLFLSQECGEKMRSICHMEPGDEEYFDPSCTDMKQKMVVIIIESSSEMPLEMLRENLTLWADVNHQEDSEYLEELSEESANDLLIQSAPPVLTADVERGVLKFKKRYIYDGEVPHVQPRMPASPPEGMENEEPDSTSSSPPDIRNHFFGPPIRLLLYPPPPARGISITTEDLMCLAEGEFLNDVVIDFYLQYLYKEKLSEMNQKRTHIFSSFFYKRLTQRDRHSEKTEEDAKKSLPERRHARVKKWTKHVDLFSKDFIIVPINEHSHWHLAVICFPGLATPEVVPFIPSAAHRTDADEASNEGGGSEAGSNSKEEGNSSQETQIKHTVLGRQLSGDECNNPDEGKLVGQKQPCILMFDSLAGPSRNPNVKMLREYLQCEWNAKKSEERQIAKIVRGSTPKVPQQSNFSDCGVFLLQYVQSFFEDPIADFQIPMKGLQNWFPEELVCDKRREIHELIMSRHQDYMEERGDPRIMDIPFESTPRRPPPPIPMANNPDHFLGKLDDGAGAGEGALSKDEENSNSSAAWDQLAKPVPSPPFPVALRQNAMFEREESSHSPLLQRSEIQNEGEEEEEGREESQLSGLEEQNREEDNDTVHPSSGKDFVKPSELTSGKVDDSEGTCTDRANEEEEEEEAESMFEQSETENENVQSELETDKESEQKGRGEVKTETSSQDLSSEASDASNTYL